ncbi:MAG: ABC transporter permease [Armatimonadota bacterium]
MRYRLGILTALRALGAHKVRTALTLLGIVIGTSAVVAMVGIGQGTRAEVLRKVESLGTNLLMVNAGQFKLYAGRPQHAASVVITLTEKDAEAIADESTLVTTVAPAQSRKMQVKYGESTTTTSIVGTTPQYQDVRNFRPALGDFFDEDHARSSARVAVLGQTVVQNLFSGDDPIGETIRINKVPFEVIGVMEAKGLDISGQDQDDQIFIPLRTALRRVFNLTYVGTIYVSVRDSRDMGSASLEIRDLLHERHRLKPGANDDFTIQSQTAILETQEAVSGTFTLLLSSIGGISLLVGGIGILAIMLIAVRERTREIGIRRAIGARRKDILLQFLIETIVLTVIGALSGVVFGLVGAKVTSLATGWPMLIPWAVAGATVVFSVVIGIVFGVYPASKAASVDPIVALRSE